MSLLWEKTEIKIYPPYGPVWSLKILQVTERVDFKTLIKISSASLDLVTEKG